MMTAIEIARVGGTPFVRSFDDRRAMIAHRATQEVQQGLNLGGASAVGQAANRRARGKRIAGANLRRVRDCVLNTPHRQRGLRFARMHPPKSGAMLFLNEI
jgi:hypothetical protein